MKTARRKGSPGSPNPELRESDSPLKPVTPADRPQFAWHREAMKRNLGTIAQVISDGHFKEARCYGSASHPLLILCHVDTVATSEKDSLVRITVESARKNWNAIVSACLFLSVKFLILNRKTPLAVLKRHDLHRHPAFTYLSKAGISHGASEQELAALRGCIDGLIGVVNRIDERLQSERPE